MLEISKTVNIPENEIEMSAVRSQGTGGQNVNKVASAI
ncbi:peptide chain release factor-like protein [Planktothrix agardhii]|nr:peptide chain release factor-like protein [Planktothrix agardhii]CAD5979831.1 Peptidyl-tRNA hydrolase ArfB [Planktothrix agardhii]